MTFDLEKVYSKVALHSSSVYTCGRSSVYTQYIYRLYISYMYSRWYDERGKQKLSIHAAAAVAAAPAIPNR